MKIDIISLFPEMFAALHYGIVGRAIQKQIVQINHLNPRDFTSDPHRNIDDRPYGGGPGMVMQAEPLAKTIQAARKANQHAKCIYLSPQGKRLEQRDIEQLTKEPHLILLAGRYEGIDERLIDLEVDEELSIGDYVVSGGELPVMLLIDALTRLLPGALGHEESASQDSFSQGLLDCPHYTRPEIFQGKAVPKILLSGNHSAISRWRLKQSLGRTWQRRQDLLKRRVLSQEERALLQEFITEANEPQKEDSEHE